MATDDLITVPALGSHPDASPDVLPGSAQRALQFGFMVSGLRCIVQYVVLPFVLPWIGVGGTLPPWLTLILGMVAVAALVRNVRRLWAVRHAQRWTYLFMAGVVVASLVLFAVVDVRALFHLTGR